MYCFLDTGISRYLLLNRAPRHEDVLGSGGIAPRILNLQGERAPGTHWIGDWVGPRAGLDAVAEKKKKNIITFQCRHLKYQILQKPDQ
jgi:hypothetical protein